MSGSMVRQPYDPRTAHAALDLAARSKRSVVFTPSQRAIRAPHAAPPVAPRVRRPVSLDLGARRRLFRDAIRARPLSIGGYVCRWGRQRRTDGREEVLSERGFYEAIASERVQLLINHEPGWVASQTDGSLYLRCDDLGLWCEASLSDPAVYARVQYGAAFSTGYMGPDSPLREVSLILPPVQPGRRGVWALPNGLALVRRQREFAAAGVPLTEERGRL